MGLRAMRSISPMRKLIGMVPLLHRDNLLGQGVRFAIAGGVVATVNIGITTGLAAGSQMPFQVVLAIGWVAAITVHFTLQRFFVWTHEEGFALPFRRQIRRYLLLAGSQFTVTAIATAVLPSLLDLSAVVIYLAVTGTITLTNFLVFRRGVFHADTNEPERPLPASKEPERALAAVPDAPRGKEALEA